jgi:DnaJ-domain-containing protein 1
MKSWKYKLIGLLIGVLLRRPAFIILGFILGHLLDIDFFKQQPEKSRTTKQTVENLDAYTVLEVTENASLDEIEQAYRKKISEYHPDKVANAAPELQALAEQRAREINAAYDALQKLHQKP